MSSLHTMKKVLRKHPVFMKDNSAAVSLHTTYPEV